MMISKVFEVLSWRLLSAHNLTALSTVRWYCDSLLSEIRPIIVVSSAYLKFLTELHWDVRLLA